MDISPIIISMKTATIAILFTFILGLLAARWILYRKSDATRIFWDGIFTMPLVLPPTVAGFFLLVFFGSYGPVGKLFENYLGIKIAFSLGRNDPCGSCDVISIDVPFCKRCPGTD